jgi:hypothetical protein
VPPYAVVLYFIIFIGKKPEGEEIFYKLMNDLCVTFEEWHLGDGNYPPLHRGQKVNFSFYISLTDKKVSDSAECYFRKVKHSDYTFCGEVIRNYNSDHESQIIIVDTGIFKFYIEDASFSVKVGQFITGQGSLLIDYYIWVEYLSSYVDPPELFYSFIVDGISKVKIPEKFIYRHDKGYSAPTSLSPTDYSDNDLIEIEDMRNDKSETSFYLLNLKRINENIAKTFH